jgi:hypothetical protein
MSMPCIPMKAAVHASSFVAAAVPLMQALTAMSLRPDAFSASTRRRVRRFAQRPAWCRIHGVTVATMAAA